MGVGLLRFILAIIVMCAHIPAIYGYRAMAGDLPVQLFFVLSGFYMFLILDKSYVNPIDFYKNRMLRIYPIYFIMLILTLVFYEYPAKTLSLSNIGVLTWGHILFSNITLFFNDIFLFLAYNIEGKIEYFTTNFTAEYYPAHLFIVIPSSWALGMEMMFYLWAPFFFKQKNGVLLLIILMSFTLRIILYNIGLKNDPWSYRFFFNEIGLFLLGALSYRVYKKTERVKIHNEKIFLYISHFILISSLLLFLKIPLPQLTRYWMIIFMLILFLPILFRGSKGEVDRFLGDLSYPIYLSYWFWFLFVIQNIPVSNKNYQTLFIILFTIIASSVLIVFIQRPIDRYRHRLNEAKKCKM